jgi:hypothetical protein
LSEAFLILRRNERGGIIIYNRLHIKSCQILMKLEFSQQILYRYSNIKFDENKFGGRGGGELFQADGQTDRHDITNLLVAYRNFTNAHKNVY